MTILVSPPELGKNEIHIVGEAFRHHFRARRLRPGERVRLTDGEGSARWGEVVAVERSSARLRLGEAAPANDPEREVHLFVAPPRPERAAWLVEKSAELGVRRIVFITTERAPRAPGAGTLARWRRIADSGLEQSQGARRMAIEGPASWSQAIAAVTAFPRRWVLDPNGDPGGCDAGGRCAFLIGPEGGWTAAEAAELSLAGCGRFALGRRILRVETAAVVAAALALTPP